MVKYHHVYIYFNSISEPCCIIEPVMNHIQFLNCNWLTKYSGSSIHGYGFSHSAGDIRPKMKRMTAIPIHDITSSFHTSNAKGSAKEKNFGGALVGFR